MFPFKKKAKKGVVIYYDQTGQMREEIVLHRIAPEGVYIGKTSTPNEFIPMHRVLRIFIHQ